MITSGSNQAVLLTEPSSTAVADLPISIVSRTCHSDTAATTAATTTSPKATATGRPIASMPPVIRLETTTAAEKVPCARVSTGCPVACSAALATALIPTSVAPDIAPSTSNNIASVTKSAAAVATAAPLSASRMEVI